MKYFIETYGCQMNVHDSERMAGLMEQAGYDAAPEAETADVVVINTCSVRDGAENKLYSRLGEIRASGAETGHIPIVAVAGCVAQQEARALLKRSSLIDVIVGTQSLKQLPALVARRQLFQTDRKSTRLNSSHQISSYAVFCLKKETLHPLTEGLGSDARQPGL